MGGRRHLSRPCAVQENGRSRLSRPHQAGRVRRPGARLFLRHGHGRRARRHRLRQRADGDRRADRHGDAGAGPVRLRCGQARVSGAVDRRRLRGLSRRLRGRRRLRRRLDQDHGPQGRRRLRDQRRQDVDHERRTSRLDVPSRQHLGGRAAPKQVADLPADEDQGRQDCPQARQARHALVRHRANLLRQRPPAAALPDRRGGQRLHLSDAAIPGRAAVGGRRQPESDGAHDRPDHRLYAKPQSLRQVDPRQSGRAFPARRARHRDRAVARAGLSRMRALSRRHRRDPARIDGQAQGRAFAARGRRRLPAILGRHGLHEREPDQSRLPGRPARLDRRRRR